MRELLFWAIWILMFSEALNFLIKQGGSIWQSPWTTAILGILISLGTFRLGYGLSKVQIENKKSDIDSLTSRLSEKNEKLAEKDNEIGKLQEQIKEEKQQSHNQDEWLIKKDTKIYNLQNQLREKDAEIRNLKEKSEETDFVFEPILSFYNNTLEAIKDEGIKLLAKVREVNKEINPNIKNAPKPCSIEELSKVLDIDREDINELVGELKKLNLVNSFGEGGFPNSHIPRGDHYPLFITEKGKTFLFMHKLKSIKIN